MTPGRRGRSERRRLAEGCGEGTGRDYRPWITVRDAPSKGVVSRVPGLKTGRVHQVLSNLELSCFYLLDWSDRVVDIREQVPLKPLMETQAIASRLGMRHPRDPRSREPVTMTTDFVATMRDGVEVSDLAIACKRSNDLDDRRVLEKLEIERRYWQAHNTAWVLVTEHEIPKALVRNIRWVRHYAAPSSLPVPPDTVPTYTRLLRERVGGDSAVPLKTICREVDVRCGLPVGAGLALVRHAIATKTWRVDMTVEINPSEPLRLLDRAPAPGGP